MRIWNAIHFFSIVERKGRVLCQSRPEQLVTVSCTRSHAPDAVIQTTCNPLSNQIASLLCLYEVLIAVYVRDIPESLPFNLITHSMLAESRVVYGVTPTLQPAVKLAQTNARVWLDEYLDDQWSVPMPASNRLQKPCRAQAEIRKADVSDVVYAFLCGDRGPKYVPSLIQNVCPQITHERIKSSTCPCQRLGIPHLLSISFPPCIRLLM